MTPSSQPDAHVPLVSVLIRTTGRSSLAQAVSSVEHQILKDMEIVLVNAGGGSRPGLAASERPLRWIDPGRPLGRSAAANALLEVARGRYCLFLDDDDWLLPDHLSKLAAALEADAYLVAAYADVRCIRGAGTASESEIAVFDQDFDATALQLQNYLPIHAVMFRAETAHRAPLCRFAPELDLFEDWDFWLQLSARGPFRRVPGVSAVYALDANAGSGHAERAGASRREMLLKLGARQLARWQPMQVAALIEHDVSQAERGKELLQRNAVLEEAGRGSQETIDILRHEVDVRGTQLRELATTLSEQQAEIESLGRAREILLGEHLLLNEQIRLQVKMVAVLEERLQVQQQEFDQLSAYSHLQQAEIDKLTHVRLQLLHDVALMQRSLSWRLTRPLRSAKSRLRAAGQSKWPRLARWFVQVGSQAVRRHGVAGVLRRLPRYLRQRAAGAKWFSAMAPQAAQAPFDAQPPVVQEFRLHPDLAGERSNLEASVSVVIPTLNAGDEFAWLMRKLRAQRGLRAVEIVIVDSGSTDGTVALARAAGATVVEIPQSEFSHSHARNLGAQHARGDYLLFMVQDAYPIGEYWLHGMLDYLFDHAHEGLVAASCSEYSRSDSDMMYDAMINTHYKFLGCLDHDRLGRWIANDHMALRSQGQLSDVACMISRDLFARYQYRGNYAEDLDLGIRLIKDGMQVAMLASVKAVHSHNRPAYYYLKRSFVDVVFLVGMFEDFTYPESDSLPGLVCGIGAAASHISGWLAREQDELPATGLSDVLAAWIASARRALETPPSPGGDIALGEPRLDEFVTRLVKRHWPAGKLKSSSAEQQEARHFVDMFLARLEHFNLFAADVYGPQDALLQSQLTDVIRKTYAATAGAALAFHFLHQCRSDGAGRTAAQALHDELVQGV